MNTLITGEKTKFYAFYTSPSGFNFDMVHMFWNKNKTAVYAKVTGPSVFAGKFRVGLVNFFQKQDRLSSKK